jgi:GT2 family glycosyltransferase
MAPSERTRLRAVAIDTLTTYLAERESASTYDLSGALVSDPPRVATVVANPSIPSAHVLLDDGLISVHGRVPAEDARRWAERLEPLDGAPLVIFGLGLGYHALAAAARPDSGRVLVVEPFDQMIEVARATVDATREALDQKRIELVRDWSDFSRVVRQERLDLARAQFADVSGYWRLAGDAHTTFVTLFEGARAWDRAGLGSRVKPFCHEPGLSVVISTFNRPDAVRRLIDDLASQRPCGVPVEVLLVNDDGDTDGLPAICEAAQARGLDVRLFDTHFSGYGLTLARNIGLRFARYDTTVLLDDDLRIAPDLLWHYRQAPASIRAGRIDAEFDDSGVRRARPDPRLEMRGREARVLRPWNAYETFLWGGNCAVTTELGLALGGFDETFLGEGEEDTDFGARAVRATHRPVVVPGAWALHEGLDQTTRVWLGFATANRPGRSRMLLADAGRGVVVNGGVEYWDDARWAEFERVAHATR